MHNRMPLFTEDSLHQLFGNFSRKRVLIIGDVMLDAYLWGSVDRISPEAPVPVVAVNKRSSRLGGAANVALNVNALGAEAVLCSVIGHDPRGEELLQLMHDAQLDSSGIMKHGERITTTKFRIFGNRTQMLRVDEESTAPLSDDDTATFASLIRQKIDHEPWDVIIFQDYDKGLINTTLIEDICTLANRKGIPVAVDPKRRHFGDYRQVTLFKPNLKELREGLKAEPDVADPQQFQATIDLLHTRQHIDMVLVTLSQDGVYISHHGKGTLLPAHVRDVADVSGAGDTVISVAALGLASGLSPVQLAAIGNLAGGLVCEEVGVVPVNPRKLLQEALRHLA
jgi:D-glycero-beta-D-manno-heptose-7-phosphate kinase